MRAFYLSCLLLFLSSAASVLAQAPCTDFTIQKDQTLGQVAREVYGNSRQWKKIAAWNKIAPPYRVKKDLVIKLCEAPKTKKPEALATSLPSETKAPKGKKIKAAPPPKIAEPMELDSSYLLPVTQEVIEKEDELIYVVNERAPSLSMIALELYGDAKLAGEISKWNKLKKPYKLALGQKLKLEREPSKDAKKADETLVNAWESLGNKWMAERIKKNQSAVEPPPVPADLPPEKIEKPKEPEVQATASMGEAPLFEAPAPVAPDFKLEHETTWTTAGGPAFLFFRLNGEDKNNGSQAVLLSKLASGLEINVAAAVKQDLRLNFHLSGYRSTFYPNQASAVLIENVRQTAMRFGAGAEKLFGAHTSLGALLNFSDEFYFRGRSDLSGIEVNTLKVLRLDFRGRYELARYRGGLVRAGGEAGFLFPASSGNYQTKFGLSAGASIGAITAIGREWNLGTDLGYRIQSQNTAVAGISRKDLLLGIQFEWKGNPL